MDANAQRQQEQIRTFVQRTGASTTTAKEFLERAVWDMNVALNQYYCSEHAGRSSYNPTTTKKKSGIVTMKDLKGESNPPAQQSYYTGGYSSGVQVESGAKNDVVSDIFRNAVSPMTNSAENPSNPDMRTVTFWKTGFTVDNGPLRIYADEANKRFLECINKGLVPPELQQDLKPNQHLEINLVNKKHQDYSEPKAEKPAYVAFSGVGRRLGASDDAVDVATVSTSSTEVVPSAAPSSVPSCTSTESSNPSGTTARVQIRLADGTKLNATFAPTSTVGDIRAFIDAAKPVQADRSYSLMTSFPRAVLSDYSATLESADLLNAVIIQKWN